MYFVANSLILIISLLHIYFMILEMFLWTKPVGLKVFRQSLESANSSRALAANQGLYNGFLAVGLIWSLINPSFIFSLQLKFFFLGCVAFAGIYGAYSVNRRIFFIQALPAILALALLGLKTFGIV